MKIELRTQVARLSTPSSQSGFTLIELITVIVIIGVLAAIAVPRYADMQSKARIAKVQSTAGSIKSAAALTKALAMAAGDPCNLASPPAGQGGGSFTIEGTTVLTKYCYPDAGTASANGIKDAINTDLTDWTVTYPSAGSVKFALIAGSTPANCSIVYTNATSGGMYTLTTDVTAF